jgi:hypothetical protein
MPPSGRPPEKNGDFMVKKLTDGVPEVNKHKPYFGLAISSGYVTR